MKHTTASSWLRFSRGFLRGSLLGFGLLAVGLASWGIARLIGVEKDTSTNGMSALPLYILSFGLGGSALALLRSDKPRWTESLIAWAAAVTIVLAGCSVIAFLSESDRPIEPYWGFLSSLGLLAMLIISALGIRVRTVTNNAEPNAPGNSR